MAIIFKISVRFTLQELRCEFSSSFDIISGFEEEGILFLQIVIAFGMKKKKKKMRVKKNFAHWDFFPNKKKKDHSTIWQELKLAEESFLTKV